MQGDHAEGYQPEPVGLRGGELGRYRDVSQLGVASPMCAGAERNTMTVFPMGRLLQGYLTPDGGRALTAGVDNGKNLEVAWPPVK